MTQEMLNALGITVRPMTAIGIICGKVGIFALNDFKIGIQD